MKLKEPYVYNMVTAVINKIKARTYNRNKYLNRKSKLLIDKQIITKGLRSLIISRKLFKKESLLKKIMVNIAIIIS